MPRGVAIPALAAAGGLALAVALHPPTLAPPSAVAEAEAPAIRDMRGRPVTATPPARRVVIFPPILWSYLTIDGSADHIAGLSRYLHDTTAHGLMGDLYPAALTRPVVNTQGRATAIPGDPESLLALHPDAVFTWSWFSEPLERIGVPVVRMDEDYRRHRADLAASWRLVAAVAGKPERAEALLARYHREHEELAAETAAARAGLSGSGLRTLFVYEAGPGGLTVAGADAPMSRMMQAAGGVPVTGDGGGLRIGPEQLIALAPDVIILGCCFSPTTTPRFFYDHPAFRTIPAVRNRRVYKHPIGGARGEGLVEEPLLWRWTAEILLPDTLASALRSRFHAAYRDVYGADIDDATLDRVLLLDENAGSSGYGRFAAQDRQ